MLIIILFSLVYSFESDYPCVYSQRYWTQNNIYSSSSSHNKWIIIDTESNETKTITEDTILCTMTWYNLTSIDVIKLTHPENMVWLVIAQTYITSKLNIYKLEKEGFEYEIPNNVINSLIICKNILDMYCDRMNELFDNTDDKFIDIYKHIENLNNFNNYKLCLDDNNSEKNHVTVENITQAFQMTSSYGLWLFFDISAKEHGLLLLLFISIGIIIILSFIYTLNNCFYKCGICKSVKEWCLKESVLGKYFNKGNYNNNIELEEIKEPDNKDYFEDHEDHEDNEGENISNITIDSSIENNDDKDK